MRKHVDELIISSDLSTCSFWNAFGEFHRLAVSNGDWPEKFSLVYCITQNDWVQKDFKSIIDIGNIRFCPVEWLDEDAWFITNGKFIIFSPGG